MAWLAKLDARSETWPRIGRWPYLGLRWFLISMGVFLACALAAEEWQEHRVGLGTGIAVVSILAVIKGVITAITSPPPSAPASPHRID